MTAPRKFPIRVTPSAQAIIKGRRAPRLRSSMQSIDRAAAGYTGSDDCSTGTPGPIVEDTETLFR
jgi:hypothetical protein